MRSIFVFQYRGQWAVRDDAEGGIYSRLDGALDDARFRLTMYRLKGERTELFLQAEGGRWVDVTATMGQPAALIAKPAQALATNLQARYFSLDAAQPVNTRHWDDIIIGGGPGVANEDVVVSPNL